MSIIGHLIALLGLFGLYAGEILFGSIVFFVGGFLASKLFICLRSGGVMMMVTSIAYGYHDEYSLLLLLLIFAGFVLACFNTSQASRNHIKGWGFDIDLYSPGSESDFGGDGDGGGD